tara:strand:- start:48 stop:932 length:885 start_codon:yes stop_codon:yes gene_type:complete
MPTVLQFRRGTTTQNNSFTGTAGELSIDTTLDTIRVHDASTAGGFALLKETGVSNLTLNAQAEIRLGDSDSSNYVGFKSPGTVASNLIFTLPSADGTSGQALVTDASGTLSFAAAGATVSQDNSSNTNFNLYYAATTSGALTAVNYDGADLLFNPSTSTLSCTNFSGVAGSAKYADLAEMYASDGDIEAGTVVHFSGEGKVAECDIANCRSVAGIVSTDPAYLMNSDADGVALAIAGRVPTKVTGVVNAGDLIVSAGNGRGMANNDAAIGTVIGKAIESNEGGDGVIEVLALMM